MGVLYSGHLAVVRASPQGQGNEAGLPKCRYYGSARLKEDSVHWGRARELGRQVAELLGCTTWSGGGPGMMESATLGHPPSSVASLACWPGCGYPRA